MKKPKEVEIYTPRHASLDYADMAYLPGSGIEELNLDTFRYYRNFFRLCQNNHPYNQLNDETFLERIGGCVLIDGKIVLTKAGLLLFGNDHHIRRYFPYYSLSFIDKRDPYLIQQSPTRLESFSGDWSGNLFDFVLNVSGKVADAQLAFSKAMPNDGNLVQIVRELLSVALCNIEFIKGNGLELRLDEKGLMISFQVDKGTGLMTINRGQNANPTIANALACVNLAKRKGMGLPFVRRLCNALGFSDLSVTKNEESKTVKIEFEFEASKNSTQENAPLLTFEAYLYHLRPLEQFTRQDAIKATGKSPATISLYIKKALSENKITLAKGYKQGCYVKQ